jgi:hypothetical protein
VGDVTRNQWSLGASQQCRQAGRAVNIGENRLGCIPSGVVEARLPPHIGQFGCGKVPVVAGVVAGRLTEDVD